MSANSEIAVLQTQVEALQLQLTEERNQRAADTDKIMAKLDSLKADIARHVPCPAPGACTRLEAELKSTAAKVQVLNDARQRALGERTMIGVVSGAVGAVVITILGWFLTWIK